MSSAWIISLAREDAVALAPLRLQDGIEVGETERQLWLRAKTADDRLDRALLRLPATARYEWLPDNRLRQLDSRIPCGTLPALQWQPLSAWLRAELEAAALPGLLPAAVTLKLVRSCDERPAEILLTSFDEWSRFTNSAAEIRLRQLSFAVNARRQVLVRGRPLPPVPGQQFVLWGESTQSGVAVPLGFKWLPEVSVEVLMRRLGVAPDCIGLWFGETGDDSFLRIHAEQFVAASRAAVRATAENLA